MSLPDDLVAAARDAVARGQFASVSAYVADAMRRGGKTSSLADLLAEWDVELGPPGPEAEAWADDAMRRLRGT